MLPHLTQVSAALQEMILQFLPMVVYYKNLFCLQKPKRIVITVIDNTILHRYDEIPV